MVMSVKMGTSIFSATFLSLTWEKLISSSQKQTVELMEQRRGGEREEGREGGWSKGGTEIERKGGREGKGKEGREKKEGGRKERHKNLLSEKKKNSSFLLTSICSLARLFTLVVFRDAWKGIMTTQRYKCPRHNGTSKPYLPHRQKSHTHAAMWWKFEKGVNL